MKTTVSSYEFVTAFEKAGRKDQFSRSGLIALFDWLEEYEQDCGEEIELDVIAICCDYSEYESAIECCKEYDFTPDSEDEEEAEKECLEWLQDRTIVIQHEFGIIIQNF